MLAGAAHPDSLALVKRGTSHRDVADTRNDPQSAAILYTTHTRRTLAMLRYQGNGQCSHLARFATGKGGVDHRERAVVLPHTQSTAVLQTGSTCTAQMCHG